MLHFGYISLHPNSANRGLVHLMRIHHSKFSERYFRAKLYQSFVSDNVGD